MYLFPTLEEIERASRELNPTYRTMRTAFNYINSDRGTMGQDLLFSRDEDEFWDDPFSDTDWEEDY